MMVLSGTGIGNAIETFVSELEFAVGEKFEGMHAFY